MHLIFRASKIMLFLVPLIVMNFYWSLMLAKIVKEKMTEHENLLSEAADKISRASSKVTDNGDPNMLIRF